MLCENDNDTIKSFFVYIFIKSKQIFVIIILIIECFIIIISFLMRLINCFKRYITIKSFLLFNYLVNRLF